MTHWWPWPILLFLLAGCIRHQAAVQPPAQGLDGLTVNGQQQTPGLQAQRVGSHLPRELLVHAWRRNEEGALLLYHAHCRTPLAWWQRFPFDVVSDLLIPVDLHARAMIELTPRTIVYHAPSQLNELALAAGYAGASIP